MHIYPKSVDGNILERFHQKRDFFVGLPASGRIENQLDIQTGFLGVLDCGHIILIDIEDEVFEQEDDAVVDGGLDAVEEALGVVFDSCEDECVAGFEQKYQENYDCRQFHLIKLC